MLAQRVDELLDGAALAVELAVGRTARIRQGTCRQPLEGGQQHPLVAADEQPPEKEPEQEPGEKGEKCGHGRTVAAGSDRTPRR